MQVELRLKREIIDLQKEVEHWKAEAEYWQTKAHDMYGEYQLLCDKIVSRGIFFKRGEEDSTDG